MIKSLIKKYKFDKYSDRLGPDCPFTHWKLYFKNSMQELCKKSLKLLVKMQNLGQELMQLLVLRFH